MADHTVKRPKDRHGFKIGIICALRLEAEMVELVFDKRWKKKEDGSSYGRAHSDLNTYTTGSVAGHNVVLAYCPGMGNNSAAQVATWLMASFTGVKIALVVGICGAVPSYSLRDRPQEIMLGDCLVSTAVIQFDLGREGLDVFVKKDSLNGLGRTSTQIRGLISRLQTFANKQELTDSLLNHLEALKESCPEATKYPGRDQDQLYKPSCVHTHQTPFEACEKCNTKLGICEKSCKDLGCDDKQLEHRKNLSHNVAPNIHFGYFGSSNTVLKSGLKRDQLAKTDKIIAFEMGGAGVWDVCPTIIIKAACDYADSHKNKIWQKYAAAVAAAGLKAFLGQLEFSEETSQPKGKAIQSFQNRICAYDSIDQSETRTHHVIPFHENRHFVRRESKLQMLEEWLLVHKQCFELAIYGLGGVGKTQLALAFAYHVKAVYPDCSIFWVSAMSTARFKQDYMKIAKECFLTLEFDEENAVQQVQEHLSSEAAGRWLLIIDNADNKDVLFEEDVGVIGNLPRSESGIILFTTRHKEIAVDVADGNILSLEEMAPAEAKTFLQWSLGNDYLLQDEQSVEQLLEELTFLPLAIAQASAYITRASITIPEYLALMRNTQDFVELLSRDFRDKTRDKESRNAIAVTWLVSFSQIEREDPVAMNLLFFMACIESNAIPRSILPLSGSEGDLNLALGVLLGYSFLTQQGDADVYDMHRLVHHAIKFWMQEQNIVSYWQDKTILHLANIFPSDQWENRSVWQAYAPHTSRVLQDTRLVPTKLRSDLCLALGQCLRQDGRISEAVKWISQCASWRDKSLPEDDASHLSAQLFIWRDTGQKKYW